MKSVCAEYLEILEGVGILMDMTEWKIQCYGRMVQ